MENLIPVFTLIFGAVIGGAVAWLALHAKARRGFDDGKAAAATEIAALQERVAAKDRELHKLQETFDAEVIESDGLRQLSAGLQAQLEGERRAAQERSESFKRVTEELAEAEVELGIGRRALEDQGSAADAVVSIDENGQTAIVGADLLHDLDVLRLR